MKKALLFALLLIATPAFADENVISIPSGLELRQGFVIPWNNANNGFMNMTTVTIVETEPWDGIGNWNILWDGWQISVAWSYDAGTSRGGLMFGRHLGTLGKYLPLKFPLSEKIDVSYYPIGIIADNVDGKIELGGASGASFLKFDVAF